jgi:hypothetical protein
MPLISVSRNRPSLRIYQSMALMHAVSDFHYGMLGTSHSYRYDQFGRASTYILDDFTPWYKTPSVPDTSFAAVQKTPFYKRSIKSGSPSQLLSNLISTL